MKGRGEARLAEVARLPEGFAADSYSGYTHVLLRATAMIRLLQS